MGIEAKRKGGKQSPAQKDTEGRIKKSLGYYWLVDDVEVLEGKIKQLIEELRGTMVGGGLIY